jgi:hypothetical protein
VTTAGFHDDIPERDYHADRASLSVTGAKTLMRSPALFRHQQDNPVHKDVFDIGSAAHQLVLGVGPGIAVIPATGRTKVEQETHKAAKEAARAEGKIPLSADDYTTVRAMADKLSEHTLAMRLLSDGRPEVSAYAPDEATGIMRRCRFDWLGSSVLTDYKSAMSADPRDLAGRYGAVRKWGYDCQAAWYTDLARDLGHPAAAFAFIFQEKTAPYQVTVAYVPDEDLYDARARNRLALERFRDCTAADVWPDYIPHDTAARLSLTDQTYEEEAI